MNPFGERARKAAAFAGVGLWLGYPFAWLAGLGARWEARCGHRTFSGRFDDCFNDFLPVIELAAFPLTLLLLYPSARFAFSLWAPSQRNRRWRLAGSRPAATSHPLYPLLCGAGLVWCVLHLRGLPLAALLLWAYWLAWIAWFVTGGTLAARRADRAPG